MLGRNIRPMLGPRRAARRLGDALPSPTAPGSTHTPVKAVAFAAREEGGTPKDRDRRARPLYTPLRIPPQFWAPKFREAFA